MSELDYQQSSSTAGDEAVRKMEVNNIRNDDSRFDAQSEHTVEIEGKQVPLHHVLQAYAGLARFGTYYAPSRNLPSMAPVGLIGFAMPAILLGLILTGVRGITIPNYINCVSWFVGSLGLLCGGIWEFFLENTNGSALLATYGLFWWSLAAFYTPSFGVTNAFVAYCTAHSEDMPTEFSTAAEWATSMMTTAMGYWMMGWMFFAVLPVLTLLKSTVAFFTCLFFVFMLFLMITIGYLMPNVTCNQVAGGFTVAAGIFAIYNAMAGIMTKENSYVQLKAILLPGPKAPLSDEEKA